MPNYVEVQFRPNQMYFMGTAPELQWYSPAYDAVTRFVLTYSDSVEQIAYSKFQVPNAINADGTVLIKSYMFPQSSSASGNVRLKFSAAAARNETLLDQKTTSYVDVLSNIVAMTSTIKYVHTSWSATVSSLGWQAGDLVYCKWLRDINVTNSMYQNLNIELFSILIPVTLA